MIKAGIVGLGRWGRILVEATAESREICFVKGTTRTLANANDFADKNGFALVSSYEDLLRDPEIDALVFATPHSHHEGQVIAAASAGKHVFVEKPFTLEKSAAERAVAAVDERGVVLGLGHNRRFHPSMQMMRDKISSGEVGTIVHIDCTMTGPAGQKLTGDHWRARSSEAPGGAMTAIGIHLVDGIIDLAGPIEEVFCRSVRRFTKLETEDTTSVSLQLKSGATASLMCSIVAPLSYRFAVIGTKGIAAVSTTGLDRFDWQPLGGGAPECTMTSGFDTVRAELEAFAKAINSGGGYRISHDEMIHGSAVLEAAVISAANGQPVEVA